MKSQSDNKEHQNLTAKKKNLFNLESFKLMISSKGDLGLHCTQTNVQLQLKKQISCGPVQWVVAIMNVECYRDRGVTRWAGVTQPPHGCWRRKKRLSLEMIKVAHSTWVCTILDALEQAVRTHSLSFSVKWGSHLVQASSIKLNPFSVFQVWNSLPLEIIETKNSVREKMIGQSYRYQDYTDLS